MKKFVFLIALISMPLVGQMNKHNNFQFLLQQADQISTIERHEWSISKKFAEIIGASYVAAVDTSDTLFTIAANDSAFARPLRTIGKISLRSNFSGSVRVDIYVGSKNEYLDRTDEQYLPPPLTYFALASDAVYTITDTDTNVWIIPTKEGIPNGSWWYAKIVNLTASEITGSINYCGYESAIAEEFKEYPGFNLNNGY